MSMPFNSSTCIVWYNKDVFEKAGLDPEKFPATWPEVVSLARTLRDKGATQYPAITASVVWAHFEQFSAIHNIPYATEANGFKGLDAVLKINSAAHVANLQRLLEMSKEGAFHYTGRDGSGDGAFLSGQSGMTFSSSALRGDLVRSAKFRWAPAFLPYDPAVIREPINSAIGGASFWVLTAPQRSAPSIAPWRSFCASSLSRRRTSSGAGSPAMCRSRMLATTWRNSRAGSSRTRAPICRYGSLRAARSPTIRAASISAACRRSAPSSRRNARRRWPASRVRNRRSTTRWSAATRCCVTSRNRCTPEMVVGVWRDVVERLTPVPPAERQRFLDSAPDAGGTCGAHASVAALHQIELRHRRTASLARRHPHRRMESGTLPVPEESARILQRNRVDLALLTEMDVGVLRTGQVHTIGRVAAQLGQGYCYDWSFSNSCRSAAARLSANGSDNTEGFHGNGIVSSLPMEEPVVIRLDEKADWYTPADRPAAHRQSHGGRRQLQTACRFVACSVHWRTAPMAPGAPRRCGRCWMRSRLCRSVPVVIGGDLNTHVVPGGHNDASEPLFAMAASRGYDWARLQPGATDDAHQHLEPERRHASARLVLHTRPDGTRPRRRAGAWRGCQRTQRPRTDSADTRHG